MKKLFKSLFAIVLAVTTLCCLSACSWPEFENGSKIQRIKIELEFLDANGTGDSVTQTVEAKLYTNFAPETIEHFLYLAESGYYNDTVVSNVGSLWCEFGAYTQGTTSKEITKKEYTYSKLKGEFEKNGWTGNKLRTTAGSLIMKRNYNTNDGVSQYDSAESAFIVTFDTTTHFNYTEYCVFGTIVSDDATDDSSTSTSSLEGKSSLEKIQSISTLSSDSEGNKTYYNEKENKYYSVVYDAENVAHFYNGLVATDEQEIKGSDATDFSERLSDEANYFFTVPCSQVKIKSIVKV